MAPFKIEELPTLERPGHVHRKVRRVLPLVRFSRRQVVAGSGVALMGLSLHAIGLLPPARRANATHKLNDGSASFLYDWDTNGCPNFDWYDSHGGTCAEPCGPSQIHQGSCFGSEAGQWQDWHRDHSSGDGTTWMLRPNECPASVNGDAWKWKVTDPCNGIQGPNCNNNSLHRCHDGYHNHGSAANPDWHKSICRTKTNCDQNGSN